MPNWIAAVSTAFALFAAGVAAYFAWRSLRGERDRDARHSALGLSAWWVQGTLNERDVWGIVICNYALAVFHEIEIEAVGNGHPKATRTITFRTLPPGQFFVESMAYSQPRPWGDKIRIPDDGSLQPLTNADSRRVRRISFTDMAANAWTWSPDQGLIARTQN